MLTHFCYVTVMEFSGCATMMTSQLHGLRIWWVLSDINKWFVFAPYFSARLVIHLSYRAQLTISGSFVSPLRPILMANVVTAIFRITRYSSTSVLYRKGSELSVYCHICIHIR